MPSQNTLLIVVSIGMSAIVISFLCYWLWRGFKMRMLVLWGNVAGDCRAVRCCRDEAPAAYWILFTFGLLLIPVILWLMIHRVHNLLHGISA
jgi:hypothetical protein